mgnify:CR=1 FL=1
MSIEKDIERMDEVCKNPKEKALARLYGGVMVAFTSLYSPIVIKEIEKGEIGLDTVISGLLFIEGVGDMVSGKQHYLSLRGIKYKKYSYQYINKLFSKYYTHFK